MICFSGELIICLDYSDIRLIYTGLDFEDLNLEHFNMENSKADKAFFILYSSNIGRTKLLVNRYGPVGEILNTKALTL